MLVLESYVYEYNQDPRYAKFTCTDKDKSNQMALSIRDNLDVDIMCDGNNWQYRLEDYFHGDCSIDPASPLPRCQSTNKILCVNCPPSDLICSYQATVLNPLSSYGPLQGRPSTWNSWIALGSEELCFTEYFEGRTVYAPHGVRNAVFFQMKQVLFVPLTVPAIMDVNAWAVSSTALAVTVSLDGFPPGGKVYCAFVETNRFVFTSVDQIKLLAIQKAFQQEFYINRKSHNVTLTLDGLIPRVQYEVWCLAEDASGNSPSLTTVSPYMRKVFTLCCRSIVFTNAPSSVYGDSFLYDGVLNSMLYVFSYSIGLSPGATIEVVPLLFFASNGSLTTGVRASPTSLVFKNGDKITTSYIGSFILDGIAGTYLLKLNLVATNAIKSKCLTIVIFKLYDNSKMYFSSLSDSYDPAQITVKLVLDDTNPSDPKIASVTFSDSGSSAVMVFDSATDLGLGYLTSIGLRDVKTPALIST